MAVRQYLGVAGIVVALAGVALENKYVIWGAIGLLVLSVAIRLVRSRRTSSQDPPEADPAE